jgi:hypothetical protein
MVAAIAGAFCFRVELLEPIAFSIAMGTQKYNGYPRTWWGTHGRNLRCSTKVLPDGNIGCNWVASRKMRSGERSRGCCHGTQADWSQEGRHCCDPGSPRRGHRAQGHACLPRLGSQLDRGDSNPDCYYCPRRALQVGSGPRASVSAIGTKSAGTKVKGTALQTKRVRIQIGEGINDSSEQQARRAHVRRRAAVRSLQIVIITAII